MSAMKQLSKISESQMLSISVIINELVCIVMKHKKAALIFFIVELWIHSLMFQHLTELKSIWEAIPFIH